MQVKQAQNARSSRVAKKRKPQVNENVKQGMFVKGHKTSQIVNDVLNDLHSLKKPDALKYYKKEKNSQHGPFEDVSSVEFFSSKSDASLFAYGSHSKKRPHNLILGRLFDHHMLDMLELGITNYKAMSQYKPTQLPMLGSKPCFAIIGPQFQHDEKYSTAANLIVDIFRGRIVQNINLKGLDHVITLSVGPGDAILFRHYYIHMKKSGTRVPRVELEEIGPSLDLVVRRQQFGAAALRNLALQKPKVLRPKKKKNVSSNVFHDKVGTVHVHPQNLDKITENVKKPKALRKRKISDRGEEGDQSESNQGPEPKKK